ncbi:MAG: GGDEF domain-containing protein [Porticoccus sp.]
MQYKRKSDLLTEGSKGDEKSSEATKRSPLRLLLASLQLGLEDFASSRNHSLGFMETRASYLRIRTTLLSGFMSLIFILWIPLDYQLLDGGTADNFAKLRIALAATLITLSLLAWIWHDFMRSFLTLLGVVLVLNVFYLTAQYLLQDNASGMALFGYNLFPFIFIALLPIFPLTLIEGLSLALITLVAVCIKHLQFGTFSNFIAIRDIWFLMVLVAIASWAQFAQLNMLLRLYRQATIDPLTNLLNRRKLLESIFTARKKAEQLHQGLAILIFDLDRFKRVNDTYGHISGDKVLKSFAAILTKNLRSTDIIGRFGGEEFLVCLPDTPVEAALTLAERIRMACEQASVQTSNKDIISFTTCVGVTTAEQGEDIEVLLERVDVALYKAKEQGRNRVMLAEQPS